MNQFNGQNPARQTSRPSLWHNRDEQWRDGNTLELLVNGEAFFPRVFASIRAARREVLIETFIIWEDEVGHQLQRVLIDAAKRGVNVELTIDDYGTADLTPKFVNAMTNAGVKLHRFDPYPKLFGLRLNVFRRLHRKIVVVDGVQAFVGGINFCADQLESYGTMAKQDYAVQVRGPVVQDIHQTCVEMLSHRSKKDVIKRARQGFAMAHRKKYTETSNRHRPGDQDTPATSITAGCVRALLALRDNNKHRRNIERHYLRAIHTAQTRLVLAHAYFFPGYRLLRALRNAARRGVEVKLLLQGQPDMPWVRLCSRLLYDYLMREGITIYEYCQRPLHGKLALADDHWATVGSSNLDPLSLALNLEANLIIDDTEFNRQLFDHLQQLTDKHCQPMSMKIVRRGYWWRLPFIFLSFHFLRSFPTIVGWFPAHAPELKLVRPDDK